MMFSKEQQTPLEEPLQHKPSKSLTAGEFLRIGLIAGLVGGTIYLLCGTQLGHDVMQHPDTMFHDWLAPWGHWAWIVFLLAATGLISVGFPRLVICGIAGVLFDTVTGIVLAQVATSLASIPGYYSARLLGRGVIAKRLGGRMRQFDALLKDHGFMVFLLIRLCPVGNTLVTSSLAGLSSVSFWSYFAASFVGFLPLTIPAVLLGSGFSHSRLKLFLGIGIFVAFSLFFRWYFKRSPLGKHIVKIMRSKNTEKPTPQEQQG